MKRTVLLLFSVIMSTIMMAQRKETTILEVSGNLATPLTVHTNKGTYTLYDSMELNGVVSVRSAEDANGDKVVVPGGDYKSHTSNGKSEYTRIYRFKTMYNRSSSSSSSSNRSYGGGNNGGSSYGGGYSSSSNMPYEHLRDVAKKSDNIYGTWYHHREEYSFDMYFEQLMTVTHEKIEINKFSKIEGESSQSTFSLSVLSASDNEIKARYYGERDYQMYAGDKKNGRTVAYDESYTDYFIKLINGEIEVTTNTVIKFYDRYNHYISEENFNIPTPTIFLSVPD